ncbi:MAG: hypothetical protein WDW38_006319 [Sanguina aurantia]
MMRREDADARAVYIGGIPLDVTEAILGRLFASVGEVREAKIIIDRFSGQSRGFGFIHYAAEESANIAAERMDGYLMGSRRLTVRLKGRQGPPAPRNPAQHQPYDPASQHNSGEPGPYSHSHYNQQHGGGGGGHHPHGPHYNGGFGSQNAPPPPMGHYPSSSGWSHGTSLPTYQDDPPPGLEPNTYIHRPYDLDNANAAQVAAADLADVRRAAMGPFGCYGFDPNLSYLYAPPPGDEPRPPGVDLTLEEEDFQAATAAYYAYYGEQYNAYNDASANDQMTDPSQYMTEAEYATYMCDTSAVVDPTAAAGNGAYAAMYAEYATAAAAAQAAGGGGDAVPPGEEGAGEKEGGGGAAAAAAAKKGKRGTGKPQVVQLVQLNPEELERSKKKRDEEERVRLQREREDRIKEARERARAVAAEAAAVKQEAAAARRRAGPASPSPPPPLPTLRAGSATAAAAGKSNGRGPPPNYTHNSSTSRVLSPSSPGPPRGRGPWDNNSNRNSAGGRRSLSPLQYGAGRQGRRSPPPQPSSYFQHHQQQHQRSPSPQQLRGRAPFSNGGGRSSRSPISRSPSPTYSADMRPPAGPVATKAVLGNNWARASLRGRAGAVSRSPSPLPLQRLAASAAAAVAAGGPRLGQVKVERALRHNQSPVLTMMTRMHHAAHECHPTAPPPSSPPPRLRCRRPSSHRRGLRILMRTDRQGTYSPSPGPSSPVAPAAAVTAKQEAVQKPVVKIEVTGPPEVSNHPPPSHHTTGGRLSQGIAVTGGCSALSTHSMSGGDPSPHHIRRSAPSLGSSCAPRSSEEGELSEEEGELPSPGAEAATASTAAPGDSAAAEGAAPGGRGHPPKDGRTGGEPPPGRGERGFDPQDRERDDFVDHMRGPPHYGSRGDGGGGGGGGRDRERGGGGGGGGRERGDSRDRRMSGGGRSRSPPGLSHWERERERADWADRRGRGPPPGYRDGPGGREDWDRGERGMGRGRQMQGGGGGGGYRDGGGYYGHDEGYGGMHPGGWIDGYGGGPQMVGGYGGFAGGMGEWLGYYQAAAAGMLGVYAGAAGDGYADGDEGWEEEWEEEPAGGAGAAPAAAVAARPAASAAAKAPAAGAGAGGRGAGPGGRGPGAAPGRGSGYRGGSNQVAAVAGAVGEVAPASTAAAAPVV